MSNRMRVIALYSLLVVLLAWPQASVQSVLTVGECRFRVAAVAFDETALGFAPADMDPDSHVMLVELELLSGSRDALKELKFQASHGQGTPTDAIIQIAEGMVKMLSTVTMTGKSSEYSPSEDNVVWAFVVPRDASGLHLQFATEETLDLSPYIK